MQALGKDLDSVLLKMKILEESHKRELQGVEKEREARNNEAQMFQQQQAAQQEMAAEWDRQKEKYKQVKDELDQLKEAVNRSTYVSSLACQDGRLLIRRDTVGDMGMHEDVFRIAPEALLQLQREIRLRCAGLWGCGAVGLGRRGGGDGAAGMY